MSGLLLGRLAGLLLLAGLAVRLLALPPALFAHLPAAAALALLRLLLTAGLILLRLLLTVAIVVLGHVSLS